MRPAVLPIHRDLAGSSRLRGLASVALAGQLPAMATLAAAGAIAATATVSLDFSLRVPGHAILRAIFPMALGFAMAPRRMGGVMMGGSALVCALLMDASGAGRVGVGAWTSLALTGPFLDLALWHTRSGWRMYLAFALAGLATNLVAFFVRGGAKLSGLDHAGARPLAAWQSQAIVTYALCGLLAGLVSAMVWFRLSSATADRAMREIAE